MLNGDPISGKVSNGTLAGGAVGIVTWLLTTYVFKGGIPPQLAPLIPALVGAIGYFAGGYISKHQPTPKEIARAKTRAAA